MRTIMFTGQYLAIKQILNFSVNSKFNVFSAVRMQHACKA